MARAILKKPGGAASKLFGNALPEEVYVGEEIDQEGTTVREAKTFFNHDARTLLQGNSTIQTIPDEVNLMTTLPSYTINNHVHFKINSTAPTGAKRFYVNLYNDSTNQTMFFWNIYRGYNYYSSETAQDFDIYSFLGMESLLTVAIFDSLFFAEEGGVYSGSNGTVIPIAALDTEVDLSSYSGKYIFLNSAGLDYFSDWTYALILSDTSKAKVTLDDQGNYKWQVTNVTYKEGVLNTEGRPAEKLNYIGWDYSLNENAHPDDGVGSDRVYYYEKLEAKDSLQDYTWGEIKTIGDLVASNVISRYELENNFNIAVGSIKSATINNETHNFRIIGINHDKDGSGNIVAFTFEQVDTCDSTYVYNPESTYVASWELSQLHSTINSFEIEDSLESVIVPCAKKCITSAEELTTTTDVLSNLWILSRFEINPVSVTGLADEGSTYEYYKNSTSTLRNKEKQYWLRTVTSSLSEESLYWCNVSAITSTGDIVDDAVSTASCYISLCFGIGQAAPKKGEIINIDLIGSGTRHPYRVLEANGFTVKLLGLDCLAVTVEGLTEEVCAFPFNVENSDNIAYFAPNNLLGQNYKSKTSENINVDKGLSTYYYNMLSTKIKNAIVSLKLTQHMYQWTNDYEPNYTYCYFDIYGDPETLVEKGTNLIGDRTIYALGVEDIFAYLGKNEATTAEIKSMLYAPNDTKLASFWLSSCDGSIQSELYYNRAWVVHAVGEDILTVTDYWGKTNIRPVLTLDLSKIAY